MGTREVKSEPGRTTSESIEFESVPGQSKLFKDFVSDADSVSRFWPNHGVELEKFADEALDQFETDRDSLAELLLETNHDAEPEVIANIELLRDADTVAVLTGQQAGLFGGPAYSVYKALSAIKIAATLSEQGIKAVPVFWIASEDHDFDEIRKVGVRDGTGGLTAVGVGAHKTEDVPVSAIEIADDIKAAIDSLDDALPDTLFKTDLLESLRSCYVEGRTFDRAFHELLRKWLSGLGLIFVNPQTEGFRKLASPIMAKAAANVIEINGRLLARNVELAEAGWHQQVFVDERSTPLFVFDEEGKRHVLQLDEGFVVTKDGSISIEIDKLAEEIQSEPNRFSPNALLRPLVQDFVFPTVCYVGGAAEIAYFGQNSAIYDLLERPVTPIRHRSAFTVLSSASRRTLEKYDVSVQQILNNPQEVLSGLSETISDPNVITAMNRLRETVSADLESIEERLSELEPDVQRNLGRRRPKIFWHLDSLRKKFIDAQGRRDANLQRRMEALLNEILPGEALQERKIGFADLYSMHGPALVEVLLADIDVRGLEHTVLRF